MDNADHITSQAIERLTERKRLKLQLREARKNRKPEDVYKVERRCLVLTERGPELQVVAVETTAAEEALLEKIGFFKADMNGVCGSGFAHSSNLSPVLKGIAGDYEP